MSSKITEGSSVGNRLRTARKKAGLVQSQLAEKTGLSESHISQIETDKRQPSRAAMKLLSGALGIREQWIATGEDPIQREEEAVGVWREAQAIYKKTSGPAHLRKIKRHLERFFRHTQGRGKEWSVLERLLEIFEPPRNDEAEERERYWTVLRGGKQ